MSKSHGDGAPAYKDPASLRNSSYKGGNKSDMFSLGVILWEISSGKVPCGERIKVTDIIVYRLNGFRDSPFPGTPEED
ncbi:2176_t:CDS:2 [Paraglomus occultum]|uniref:2176_t:CDS:1 n=1 Tax=Paraglomus occultum TaxID=144539 RepID=A0A9N8W276_9GLOM|nr:2176_t:CDS:2 [Paraglomus occultum]